MSLRPRLALSLLAVALLPVVAVRAEKLDNSAKKFLDDVRSIILPDEEKIYRDLKGGDRSEFEKIFWARRDPDLSTSDNEYKIEYEKKRTTADERFKAGGRPGSQTDCGRVFILLGEPADVKKEGAGAQTWTLKGAQYVKGEIQITFEAGCMLAQGNRMGEQLNRVAESNIAQPNISYKASDGKPAKLVDQLPKPTPAQALLKTPREDFPVIARSIMFLKSPTPGGVYVAGVVRGENKGLTIVDAGGKKTVKLIVVTQVTDEAGKISGAPEHELTADVAADGSFIASFGVVLIPGKVSLKVAVLDPKAEKGSVATMPIEVPQFGSDDLTVAPAMLLAEIQENITPNAQDPYWAFVLGNKLRLVPRISNTFTTNDTIDVLCAFYNAKKNDAGKASTATWFTFTSGTKKMPSEPQDGTEEVGMASMGPLAVKDYFKPGKWTMEVKIKDNNAGKELVQQVTFDVVEPAK